MEMMVRLLLPWKQWPKGHVIPETPGGLARTLIQRNIAEEVSEKSFMAPLNRMMTSINAKKPKLALR